MEALIYFCVHCKHYDMINANCPAFPKGIPDSLIAGSTHDKKLEGQKTDIVWESKHPDKYKTAKELRLKMEKAK